MASSSSTPSVHPNGILPRRLCKCKQVAMVMKSKKAPNSGKLFYGCPYYDVELRDGGCGFFKWCPDEKVRPWEVPVSNCDYRDVVLREYLKEENDDLTRWVHESKDDNDKLMEDNTKLTELVKKVNEENQELKLKNTTMKKRVKDVNRRSGGYDDRQLIVCVIACTLVVLVVVVACRIF